jgi:hypothetical protein
LALDPPSSPTDYDVEIQTNTFSGRSYQVANAQPSAKWTDRDGEWLIKSFVGAHNMKYRGPAIAKVVAGAAVPTAQDGSIVVSATSKSVWNKTTIYGCPAKDCTEAAVRLAAAVVPIVQEKATTAK